MVLASMYENRKRRQAIELGKIIGIEIDKALAIEHSQVFELYKTIGRLEAHIVWRDWLRRKEAAAAAGQPFNEPMPGTIGSIASGGNAPPSLQP